VFASTGCGSDADGTGSEPAEEQPAAEKAEAKPKCKRARKALTEALASSLTIQGDGGVKRIKVVKVPDPPPAPLRGFEPGVYIVAGKLTGPGMDGTIGTWAVSKSMVNTGGGLAFEWAPSLTSSPIPAPQRTPAPPRWRTPTS
jgi:hypothetical protein